VIPISAADTALLTAQTGWYDLIVASAGGFLGGTTFTEVLVNTDSIDCTFTYESTT